MTPKQFLELLDRLENHYEYGGNEDSDGCLSNGTIDFNEIRTAFIKVIKEQKKVKKK